MKRKPVIDVARLNWAYHQPLTVASRVAVLINLVRRADRAGICFPGIKTISSDTRISEKAVRESLQVLKLCGLIEISRHRIPAVRQGRGGIRNTYRLQFEYNATPETTASAEQAIKRKRQSRPNGNGDRLDERRPNGNGGQFGKHRPNGNSDTDQTVTSTVEDITTEDKLPRKVSTEIGEHGGPDKNFDERGR